MKSRHLLPVLLVACAFVAGATPGAQTQTLSMAGYPAPGSPMTVTVTSTGAAPKKLLRYAVPAGQKARMDMTTTMSMNTMAAGMAMPMDMPAMKMVVDLAVTSVAANGDITYDLAFTDLTMEGGTEGNPMAQALQAVVGGIKGIKGTSTISNRGLTKSTKLDVGDPSVQQLMSQMTSQVETLSLPFPEEPVGVGARWEVRQALIAGGQTAFQKTEYEVVSIDGQAVTLKSKSESTAPPQSVSNPALPAGTEMTLDKLSGSGTGTTVIRLDSLVPTATSELTQSIAMTMNMGGQAVPVTTETKIKITIAPGKAK